MTRGYAGIGLFAPKIEANVGGAMRAASCYGADLIVIETPRFRHRATDTTHAQRHIPMFVGKIAELRPYDCQMVVVELVDGARALPEFSHPDRAIYVFGPEDGSVPGDLVRRAQHVVSVPTRHCMNLAATVNVVLYDRMVKNGRAA